MRDSALLDVAQDYALCYLAQQEVFSFGVVFKGGTSLRKYRAGNKGRFSTDLDFAAPDAAAGELVLDVLDGASIHDVDFAVVSRNRYGGGILDIDTPLGKPKIAATVDISTRPLWLPAEMATPQELAIHAHYEFTMPELPVPALEEALAEKLAAWYRRKKERDLYDLYWYSQRPLNEPLLRRLFVLKVWNDTVVDELNRGPIAPTRLLEPIRAEGVRAESIGLLTQPVEVSKWLATVQSRYRFITEFDDVESQIALCSPRDHYWVQQLADELPKWGAS